MRILVVDDQKTLGLALCGTLTALGHEPSLITSSVIAFELIDREDWRLVITDWMMPEMDGPELCRKIRAGRRHPYIYIIMVTGRTDRLDRLEGLAAGADDFLTKPVDEEELAVRLAIAGRILGVQAELEEKNALLQDMADLDPLTGLANRRRLSEGIDAAVSTAAARAPLSVLAIDVDHFKSYNDEFGHLAGDEVLRTIAATLRANTRASDLVARVGGEEFIVLLPGVDALAAVQIAEALAIVDRIASLASSPGHRQLWRCHHIECDRNRRHLRPLRRSRSRPLSFQGIRPEPRDPRVVGRSPHSPRS